MKYAPLVIGLLLAGCSVEESKPTPTPTPTPTPAPNGNFMLVSFDPIKMPENYNDIAIFVVRDRETGCEYTSRTGDVALTPRLNSDGRQICKREVIATPEPVSTPAPAPSPSPSPTPVAATPTPKPSPTPSPTPPPAGNS